MGLTAVMFNMIIANRLTDGLVVFFVAPGRWVEAIDDGRLIEPGQEAAAVLDTARNDELRCLVVDPNLIEVNVSDTGRRPVAIREAIRAFGPSPAARTDQPRVD